MFPRMSHEPSADLLKILRDIDFETALEVGDSRYVDTQKARGSETTRKRLARKLGVDVVADRFLPPTTRHILFFGHTGSGKTTELRVALDEIHEGRLFVVEVDVATTLDRNNVQYADLLMAMAQSLFERLESANITISATALNPLANWFSTEISERTDTRALSADIETSASAGWNIPLITSLFARFTASFKTNHESKEIFRSEIRASFSKLADRFNAFLRDVESELERQTRNPLRVVFVIDGTDKLRDEDTKQLFVGDVEQLLAIETLAIYTAPIALKYEGNLTHRLDSDLVLPMIKLRERDDTEFPPGRTALRKLLLGRAAQGAFADELVINKLIDASGGHPRELLRLLKNACEYGETVIDDDVAEQAIDLLAADHRRYLKQEDYPELVKIDAGAEHDGNNPIIHRLLLNLSLLEYNDGSWRRSHPVVRRLDGYRAAERKQET